MAENKNLLITPLTDKKLKAYLVISDWDHGLADKIKDNPWSYVINEARMDHHWDEKTKQYLSYTLYNDLDTARDYAEWWTGNCGSIAEIKEVEISIKNTVFSTYEE